NGSSHIAQYTHNGSSINTIDLFNSQMVQTPLQMQLLYHIYYWMNNVLPTHPQIPLLPSTKGTTKDPLIPPLLTLSHVGDMVEFLKTHLSSFLLDSSNIVKFCAVYPNYPVDQTSQAFFKSAIASIIITPLIDVSRTTVAFNELIQHLGTRKDYNLPHIVN